MKLSIKNTFRNLVIAALGAVVLSACGGAGSCTTCSSNSTANTGSLDKLSMAAPSSYPAGVAATVPVVVTNNGTDTINNLNYAIDSASNTTGGTITIQAASAASCRIIAAHASCTLNADIAATPASHPGSFSVVTSQGAPASGLRAFLMSSVLSVNVNIGLVQMPTNTSSGANGLTLYYPSVIVGTANGTTQVIVTAVITSVNAGTFNTIQLVDGNGTPLNYSVISGSSGTGMTNLAYGSVVSFLVTVPSGSSQVQFKAQTAANGTVVSTSANSNTILVTNPATPTGIMNVSPNYFNLTPNSESQIITLSNSGNGAISSLSFTATSPLTELSNTCAATLAAGATCQYVVTFDKNIPRSGTSNVIVNYNDGSSDKSSTATVNYRGIDPVAGLTVNSGNPNFDFSTRTSTPSQTAVVTLTNSGNSDESGFSFSPVTYFTTNTTGLENPCTISTILAPGASCSVNLEYSNSTATPQTTKDIQVNYKYGQDALSESSDIAVTYETIQSVAILAVTPNPTTFTGIVNNNVDNNTQTLSITNSGDETATLSSATFSGSNAALFSVATSSSNPCGASLAANSSCNQDVQFGPTTAAAGSQIANLDINYIPYTSATAITTPASLTGQVSSAQSAIVAAAQTSTSGFTSGDGTQFNSYQIAQGASAATITYVITNTGTVPANSFYVSGLASSGWSYSGCGSAGSGVLSPVTLAANGGTCTLTFTLNTATPTARNLDLNQLTMKWVDQDTPGGDEKPMSGTTYANVYGVPIYGTAVLSVNPTSVLVNATSTATITVTGANNYAGSQTFSVASSDAAIATVPPSASCTIAAPSSGTNTCTVTITGRGLGSANISASNMNYAISPAVISVVASLYIAPIKTVHPSDIFTLSITSTPSSNLSITLPVGFTANGSSSYTCSSSSACSNSITADPSVTAGYYLIQVTPAGGVPQYVSIPVAVVKNFAYISSSVSSGLQVELCGFDVAGFTNCQNSGVAIPNTPMYGATVLPTGLYTYIETSSGVYKCSVDQTSKLLSNCIFQSNLGSINSRAGAITTDGKYAYFNSINDSSVRKCDISAADASLTNCVAAKSGLKYAVERLTLDYNGTNLFVNTGAGNLSCALNSLSGDIISCTPSGYNQSSTGLSFNLENDKMYFTNGQMFCSYNNITQQLSSCADPFGGLPSGLSGFVTGINVSSQFAFISSTADIYQCAINNTTGLLSTCTSAPNSTAPRAEGITIFN